jgi:hypothetical protein
MQQPQDVAGAEIHVVHKRDAVDLPREPCDAQPHQPLASAAMPAGSAGRPPSSNDATPAGRACEDGGCEPVAYGSSERANNSLQGRAQATAGVDKTTTTTTTHRAICSSGLGPGPGSWLARGSRCGLGPWREPGRRWSRSCAARQVRLPAAAAPPATSLLHRIAAAEPIDCATDFAGSETHSVDPFILANLNAVVL